MQALKTGDRILFSECRVAQDFVSRFVGLMGRSDLKPEEALLFPKCNSIHTCFMRMSIDVLFLSPKGEVLEVLEAVRPWRFLRPRWNATHTVELRAGMARQKQIIRGLCLECEGVLG